MRFGRVLSALCIAGLVAFFLTPNAWAGDELRLEKAFAFGSRNLTCATFNDPAVNYTMVHHSGQDQAAADAIAYDAVRGWGYEIIYPTPPDPPGDRNGFGRFGFFDDSPNGRNHFECVGGDACPIELYDSFIGAKDFSITCDAAAVGDTTSPCTVGGLNPEGIIFRVDVPNGKYRFVAAIGGSEHPHCHRILAEDGGSGPPEDIGIDHVVLAANFDQAEWCMESFGRVGFGCYIPPPAACDNGPFFVNLDENGRETEGSPVSPTLTVTNGYIRIHQLQGNSNDGACQGRDPNGGNLVVLEIWDVGDEEIGPGIFASPVQRTIDPDVFDPGDPISVTLTVTDVQVTTTVTETIPAGFTVSNPGNFSQNGNQLSFDFVPGGSEQETYQLTPNGCTSGQIVGSVVATGAEVCGGEITVDGESVASCSEGLTWYGGVLEFLMIGPVALDPAVDGCTDDGNLNTRDYLTDGAITESTILPIEGQEIEPDFGISAGGTGVLPVPNPLINPGGAEGALQVWRGIASDQQGYINFQDANNYQNAADADTDNLVQYCVVYLDNTTGNCLDVILEVGSDDGMVCRINGGIAGEYLACRGIPGYGAGTMVATTLVPDKNIVMIKVGEEGGGTGARLVVRDANGDPINDGSVLPSLEPPAGYPTVPTFDVSRTITPAGYIPSEEIDVTITVTNASTGVQVVETFPDILTVTDNGGGTLVDNPDATQSLTFNFTGNDSATYKLQAPDTPCDCNDPPSTFTGVATPDQGCAKRTVAGDATARCVNRYPDCIGDPTEHPDATIEWAGAFGVHPELSPTGTDGQAEEWCETPNAPGIPYIAVEQSNRIDDIGQTTQSALDYLAYEGNEARGWGFVTIWDGIDPPTAPWYDGAGYGKFGPVDDSANNRGDYNDIGCTEELYDSFIGCKEFSATCDAAAVGDPDTPCADAVPPIGPEGMIFRVDVPNGTYKFVMAVGDSDNVHAHRIVAEDGGEGPPGEITGNSVVLVDNFDQAQQWHGQTEAAEPGEGVYARVGFDGKMPPLGDGTPPDPQFVNMDENGMETFDCANSPELAVTQSYIRIHALQGNSNDGCGGPRDPNGGDLVILEIWNVGGGGGEPVFKRGDSNRDGGVNIADAVYILQNLFAQGPPIACDDAADSNDDEGVNIADAVYILQNLFAQGPPMPAPGPAVCGPDTTGHPTGGAELGCADYCASACEVPPVACPPIE